MDRVRGWLRATAAAGNGPFWVLLGLTLGCGVRVAWPLLPPPRLVPDPGGVRPADRCPVPVERPGEGVVCLGTEEAARLDLLAGEVWPLGPRGERLHGPPARMAPLRRLTVGVPLDPQTASAAELEALPDIGPALARRIVEYRESRAARKGHGAGPLSSRAALLRVPGIGPHRLARITPYLIPLP
ncbi:MAG: helix-hairpin-helix domain-containing protein [Polyangia bacterium]